MAKPEQIGRPLQPGEKEILRGEAQLLKDMADGIIFVAEDNEGSRPKYESTGTIVEDVRRKAGNRLSTALDRLRKKEPLTAAEQDELHAAHIAVDNSKSFTSRTPLTKDETEIIEASERRAYIPTTSEYPQVIRWARPKDAKVVDIKPAPSIISPSTTQLTSEKTRSKLSLPEIIKSLRQRLSAKGKHKK